MELGPLIAPETRETSHAIEIHTSSHQLKYLIPLIPQASYHIAIGLRITVSVKIFKSGTNINPHINRIFR